MWARDPRFLTRQESCWLWEAQVRCPLPLESCLHKLVLQTKAMLQLQLQSLAYKRRRSAAIFCSFSQGSTRLGEGQGTYNRCSPSLFRILDNFFSSNFKSSAKYKVFPFALWWAHIHYHCHPLVVLLINVNSNIRVSWIFEGTQV